MPCGRNDEKTLLKVMERLIKRRPKYSGLRTAPSNRRLHAFLCWWYHFMLESMYRCGTDAKSCDRNFAMKIGEKLSYSQKISTIIFSHFCRCKMNSRSDFCGIQSFFSSLMKSAERICDTKKWWSGQQKIDFFIFSDTAPKISDSRIRRVILRLNYVS